MVTGGDDGIGLKTVNVNVNAKRWSDVVRGIETLTSLRVLVGIPEENAERDPKDGQGITNAAIGYINEWGLPEKNIPARPHLVPGLQKYEMEAIERLKKAAIAAVEGRPEAAIKQFNAIGLEAVSSVRAVITAGIPPPPAPKTLAARRAMKIGKGKKKGK